MKTFYLLLLSLFCCVFSYGQWNNNPSVNNVVANSKYDDSQPISVSDGAGGSIIGFYHNDDFHLQKITALGNIAWGSSTNPISLLDVDKDMDVDDAIILGDGAGGAFAAWALYIGDSDNGDIYVQHFDATGNKLWTASGIKLTNNSNVIDNYGPNLCLDGAGGIIVGWQSDNDTDHFQMMTQRVNSSGAIQWVTGGVQVCTAPGFRAGGLVSDGAMGAIFTFRDTRNDPNGTEYKDDYDNMDLYAQRINGNGQRLWTNNGAPVCTSPGNQSLEREIVSDGNGGAIILFFDFTDEAAQGYKILTQRISGSGSALWNTNGIQVNSIESYPHGIVSDGVGGAVVLTRDGDYNAEVYRAQKITPLGSVSWGTDGIALNNNSLKDRYSSNIVYDGNGNYIFAFTKARSDEWNDNELRSQKLNSTGTLLWGEDGALICNARPQNYYLAMVPSDNASAILAWGDYRNPENNSDIFASKILSNGTLAGSAAVTEYITTTNGNWNSPATWLGGVVPPNGSIVIIRHQVIINQNVNCKSLKAETTNAKVTVGAGLTLEITNE
jgi:hypothetical protein